MRFSRVLAVAAFALSGAALCQLPSSAQPVPVPVDFSGSIDTNCDQATVTPGVLASDGFALSSNPNFPGGGGSSAVVSAISCNSPVELRFEGVSAAGSNPVGLNGLECFVEMTSNTFGSFPANGPCNGFGSTGLANGQIFDQTNVALDVFSPGGPLPAGFYDFTVDLSIVPN